MSEPWDCFPPVKENGVIVGCELPGGVVVRWHGATENKAPCEMIAPNGDEATPCQTNL